MRSWRNAPSLSHSTRGMTLLEILVATSIFVVMGTIMLGVLSTATELYRRGESSRAASDEAMAAISLFDRDMGALLHPNLGGHFWAENHGNGYCTIAFTVHDREASNDGQYAVVAWRVAGQNLMRARWADVDPQDISTWPDDNAIRNGTGSNSSTTVANGMLTFHVALTGTGNQNNAAVNAFANHWVLTENGQQTAPRRGTAPYNTMDNPIMHYPQGLRLTVMFAGSSRFALSARVQSDDGAGNLRIMGAQSLPTLAGSLCRIGDEMVAYHGISANGNLKINDQNNGDQGPWNGNPARPGNLPYGRAVLGSAEPPAGGHPRGTTVQFGNSYVLTRVLPGGE